MSEPRHIPLRLANGSTLNAVHLPTATEVETSGSVFGVDYWGVRLGDGVSVLLVGTEELAACAGPVRPDEETTP